MEILVSDHWGVPADCVVSIRCGGTRRQAPLDVAAKQVLKFPVGREALNEPLKIDVLRPVATARLVIHPHEDEYNIGFLDHDNMEIGLNIKPGKLAGKTDSYAKDSRPTSAKSAVGKLEAATSAREYLETHGVLRYVQGLLHALIQLRPEDPFLFMMEQLSARRNPVVRSRPSSPVPPDRKPTTKPPPPPVPPAPLPANSEAATNKDSPRAAPEDVTANAGVSVVAPVPMSVTAADLDSAGAQPAPDQSDLVPTLSATAAETDNAGAQPAPDQAHLVAMNIEAANLDTTGAQPAPDQVDLEPRSVTAANLDTAAAQPAPVRADLVPTVSATAPSSNRDTTSAGEGATLEECPADDAKRASSTVTAMIYENCSKSAPDSSELGDSAASASASAALPSQQNLETSPAPAVSSSAAAASSAQNLGAASADPTSASAAPAEIVREQHDETSQASSLEADELQSLPEAETFGDLMSRARESLARAAQMDTLGKKLAEVLPSLPEELEECAEAAASAQRPQGGAAGDQVQPSLPEEDAKAATSAPRPGQAARDQVQPSLPEQPQDVEAAASSQRPVEAARDQVPPNLPDQPQDAEAAASAQRPGEAVRDQVQPSLPEPQDAKAAASAQRPQGLAAGDQVQPSLSEMPQDAGVAASARRPLERAARDHVRSSLPELPQAAASPEDAEAGATREAVRSASDSILLQASPSAGSATHVKVLQVELDHLTEESRALHGEVDRLNSEMITLMETNQALLRQFELNDDGVTGDESENHAQQR